MKVWNALLLLSVGAYAQRQCGNENVSDQHRFEQQRALSIYQSRPSSARAESITVPVCFFVLTPTSRAWNLTEAQLQGQLDALNIAYSSQSCCDTNESWCNGECSIDTGISFKMALMDSAGVVIDGSFADNVTDAGACVVHIENDAYSMSYGSSRDNAKKTALRKGDAKVLNVYFSDFDRFLGIATFPWEYTGTEELALDGVIIKYTTIPGSSSARFNEGDTLSHEAGHWLGLFHTFQGGCSPSDGIIDTAPERNSYFGCNPAFRPDTCDGDNLPDPIFNILDYSDDRCMYEFTEGQKTLMLATWDIFRLGNGSNRPVIPLPLGATSDSLFLAQEEKQVFNILSDVQSTRIICTLSGTERDADMYMSLDAVPTFSGDDCCIAVQEGGSGSCESRPKIITVVRNGFTGVTFVGWNFPLLNRLLGWLFKRRHNSDTGADYNLCDSSDAFALYVGVSEAAGRSVQGVTITCRDET